MSADTSLNDLEIICQSLAEGRPIDPEIQQRAIETGDRLREELRQTHGLLNVAVDLIRETRKE